MFVTNWISTTKIQKISEITNFFRHYFLSRTEVMFERTKVLSKKSSLRDKNHQNPPSLRDFSVFNHAMRNFYCTFAPVLEKATNKTEE